MEDPSYYLGFWGKSRTLDDGILSHPAAFHMLDVAAVARAWLRANRSFIPGLGPWREDYLPIILVLVALHDIGKFSRPFQAKLKDLWPASLGAYEARPQPHHGLAGYDLLQLHPFEDRLAPLFPELGRVDKACLWRSICGHHGRPPSDSDIVDTRTYCPASKKAALAFLDDLLALLKPEPLKINFDEVIGFSWWLAGLTVLSDWIGSAEDWFSYPVTANNLRDYWPQACDKATRAVAEAGLLPAPPAPVLTFSSLIGAFSPSPLQKLVADIDLPAGPLLVMIEDQMGSGKTEAALILAHRLMQTQNAGGLFIALPTMATSNALYKRLSATYQALFAEGSKPSLILAHGKRHLNDHFSASLTHPPLHPEMISGDDETASVECVAWLADDRRRSFLAACGVGTIDQAVLAVLPSRHAPLRLFGLSQHVLIIDEAHAYDAYVTAELQRLVQFQAQQGGSTIVLSATLPHTTREALAQAFGSQAPCKKNGYPLVTVVSQTKIEEHDVAPRPGLERSIELHRLENADQAQDIIIKAASRGAAIGWVRNTVDDAIAAYQTLIAHGVEATLFHARFAMGDRLTIEDHVQERFGKASTDAQRAHVLVGTQVMEQSLDLDFDLLVSDLAPVDLLLQRAGRLWRHTRKTRPEKTPRFFIVSPPPVEQPDMSWLTAFRGTAAVYKDAAVLWRSARALFAKSNLSLPEDVRGLIETVYAPDENPPAGLQRNNEKATGDEMAARRIARQNLLDWENGYSQMGGAWTNEAATPTRLADPSLSYRLAVWAHGHLTPLCPGRKAWAMSEITLPKRRVQQLPEETGDRKTALAALKAGWNRWERDIPVLILTPDESGLVGEVINQRGQKQCVRYSPGQGFLFY